jgi:hypothetical protein
MRSFKTIISILFILSIPVNFFSQDFRSVHDGVEYAEVTKEFSDKPVQMNLLRLDLTKVRLDVVHAMDAAIGVEKTSSIATRHGALAAINAGFFRLDNSLYAGDAAGALRINGIDYSESISNRIALLVINDRKKMEAGDNGIRIGHFSTAYTVKVGKTEIRLNGLNRQRGNDEIIKFTPVFHRTTLTDEGGLEVIVRRGRITAIRDRVGSSEIPPDGFVISASASARENLLKVARLGFKIQEIVTTEWMVESHADSLSSKEIGDAEDIVAGVPQLIKNGRIDITWEQEKSTKSFVETRHPRTAVAKLKDGKFLMITVDGRSEASGGLGLRDLAEYLLSLGAVDAMNLDGGGSTTMWLDGKVVNKPSDKEGERKVSDALLVTPPKR